MLAAATGVLAVVAVAVFVAVGGNRAAAGKLPLAGGDLAAARFAAKTIAKPAVERVEAPPSARAFARSFVTVTNAYGASMPNPDVSLLKKKVRHWVPKNSARPSGPNSGI